MFNLKHYRRVIGLAQILFLQLEKNPLQLRAASTDFHLKRFNIRQLAGPNPDEAVGFLKNQIIKSQRRYSHHLCLFRHHYKLFRIQLIIYVNIIDQLGKYGTS